MNFILLGHTFASVFKIYARLLMFLVLMNFIASKTLVYNFTVSYGMVAPDMKYTKQVVINNQFPGPEIRADSDDEIQINLHNLIEENISMYFDGILNKNNSRNDGVPLVNQNAIKPNNFHKYMIKLNGQSGTFMYRLYTKFHSNTAFGPLIVNELNYTSLIQYNRQYSYDEERTLVLSDYFHRSSAELTDLTLRDQFKTISAFEAILTNGQTYNETNNTDNESSKNNSSPNLLTKFNNGHFVLNVEQNKTYRIRVIGASTLSYFSFEIEQHEFEIIEVDGVFVEPVIKTNYLLVNSGERYSIRLTTNKKIDNYWIKTRVKARDYDPRNGNAILSYKGAYPNSDQLKYQTPPKSVLQTNNSSYDVEWIVNNLSVSNYYKHFSLNNKSKNGVFDLPLTNKADRIIEVDATSKSFKSSIRYTVNKTVFGDQDVIYKYLFDDNDSTNKLNTTLNNYGEVLYFNDTVFVSPKFGPVNDRLFNNGNKCFRLPGVHKVYLGDVVDIVFTGYMSVNKNCFQYPWHIHGHKFYDMGHSDGNFSMDKYSELINNKLDLKVKQNQLPLLRDTITTIPKYSPYKQKKFGDGCGFKVVRFVADSVGAWAIHGNYNAHRAIGMQTVLAVLPRKSK